MSVKSRPVNTCGMRKRSTRTPSEPNQLAKYITDIVANDLNESEAAQPNGKSGKVFGQRSGMDFWPRHRVQSEHESKGPAYSHRLLNRQRNYV